MLPILIMIGRRMNSLIESLRARKLGDLRAALAADPKLARQARPVVEAGRLAFQPALVLLRDAGADLNASFRNYRALHSLPQKPDHLLARLRLIGEVSVDSIQQNRGHPRRHTRALLDLIGERARCRSLRRLRQDRASLLRELPDLLLLTVVENLKVFLLQARHGLPVFWLRSR